MLFQVPVLIVIGLYCLSAGGLVALYGKPGNAWLACATVAVPQLVVAALLLKWERELPGAVVGAVLVAQLLCMARLLRDSKAGSYRTVVVALFVVGIGAAAIGILGP